MHKTYRMLHSNNKSRPKIRKKSTHPLLHSFNLQLRSDTHIFNVYQGGNHLKSSLKANNIYLVDALCLNQKVNHPCLK